MNSLSKDYHIKSFISNYKKYFDISLIKKDEGLFYNQLDKVRGEIIKIKDINKSTLFIGNNQELDKYVFLSCFSMLDRLVSNRYSNIMNLTDIWFKNSTSENMRVDNNDVFYSEQDIREDVLCVYVNKWMSMNKLTATILNTIITSRNNKVNNKGERLITWVYYDGSIGDLKDSCLDEVYNMFVSNKHLFQVISLSSEGFNNAEGINTGVGVNCTNSVSSLDDIY